MSQGRPPHYNFNDFLTACGSGSVFVTGGAMKTAETDFGFATQEKVLDFISEGGLENPQHANTDEIEKSPLTPKPIFDSYDFYSGFDYGYIAFYQNQRSKTWVS